MTTDNPDFKRLLASARRCDAAYLEKEARARTAFEALNCVFLGQYRNADHQAVLSLAPDGRPTLTIAGTRISDGALPDLFDDIDITPHDVGGGRLVTKGAWSGLDKLWSWALTLLPSEAVIDVEGHSLGAWRTRYTPLFLPAARIGTLTALDSPKGANAAFWDSFPDVLPRLTSLVNGRDPWVGWPWIEIGADWCHPPGNSLLWLHESGWSRVTEEEWPGGLSLADHGIGTAIIPALEKRAA